VTSKLERRKIKSGKSRKGGGRGLAPASYLLWPALAAIFFPASFRCFPIVFLWLSYLFPHVFMRFPMCSNIFILFQTFSLPFCYFLIPVPTCSCFFQPFHYIFLPFHYPFPHFQYVLKPFPTCSYFPYLFIPFHNLFQPFHYLFATFPLPFHCFSIPFPTCSHLSCLFHNLFLPSSNKVEEGRRRPKKVEEGQRRSKKVEEG